MANFGNVEVPAAAERKGRYRASPFSRAAAYRRSNGCQLTKRGIF